MIEQSQGAYVYEETSQPLKSQWPVPIVITDWTRGVGVERAMGVPQTLGALHASGGPVPFSGYDGSFGPGMPGPDVQAAVISAGKRCRAIQLFGPDLLFALDNQLYASANHLGTDAVLLYTADGNITSLAVSKLQASVDLLYIGVQGGPMVTYDGLAFQQDAATTIRNGSPQAVFRTIDGTTYQDFSAVETDNQNATAMDISSFGDTSGNKWFVVGYWSPYTALNFLLGNKNGAAARATVLEAYNGTGWDPVTVITDTTVSGGTTMAKDGKVSFARPTTWVPTVLNDDSQSRRTYFLRVSFSGGALDSSVSIQNISVDYREEIDAFQPIEGAGVMWAVQNGNRAIFTKTGGRKPTWSKSQLEVDAQGTVIGMAAVQNTAYILRTTDLFSPDVSGQPTSYLNDLFLEPVDPEDGVMLEWDQTLIFSHGQRLFSWSPVSGLDAIGPERFITSDTAAVQSTMVCGAADRSHCLYLASFNPTTGDGYLWRYGVFRRQVDPQTDTLQWTRSKVLSMISWLGDVKITSMRVAYSGDQPYLLMGSDDGTVYRIRVPRGVSALDPDSGYHWTTNVCWGDLPTFEADNAASTLVVPSADLSTRQTGATCTVALYAKNHTSQVYDLKGVVTQPGLQHLEFVESASGAGVDFRLALQGSSVTNPPLVDTLALNALENALLEQQVITLSARVDAYMQDADGMMIPWDPDSYKAHMDEIASRDEPQDFIQPWGTQTIRVKALQVGSVMGRAVEGQELGRVIKLSLVRAR